MHLVDYTHPERIPELSIQVDRRSPEFYLRLDELPPEHPYYLEDWVLFPYPVWLEGGSAWVQASYIAKDLGAVAIEFDLNGEIRPVVGSGELEFDEALAHALQMLGWNPLIAELKEDPEDIVEAA